MDFDVESNLNSHLVNNEFLMAGNSAAWRCHPQDNDTIERSEGSSAPHHKMTMQDRAWLDAKIMVLASNWFQVMVQGFTAEVQGENKMIWAQEIKEERRKALAAIFKEAVKLHQIAKQENISVAEAA